MIRRNERPIAIHNSIPICISIGSQPRQRLFLAHCFSQWLEIFFRRIRPAAFKKHIPLAANRRHRDTMIRHHAIQPASPAAVHRIANKSCLRLPQRIESHQFREPRQIRIANLCTRQRRSTRSSARLREFIRAKSRRARFDVVRNLRQSRAAVRTRKFQTVIVRGIVAGRNIHRAGNLPPHYLVANRRCRRRPITKQHRASARFQHARRRQRKRIRKAARVVPNQNLR